MFRKISLRSIALACSLTSWLACASATAQSTSGSDTRSASAKSAARNENKLDLNSASRKDLESLPGIGAASAKKIIAGRPYSSLSDLAKAGISQKTAQKLAPFVTIGGVLAEKIAAAPATEEKTASASSEESPATPTHASKAKTKTKTAQLPPEKGMVWVNLDSGVYHKEGTRWYGKTKNGKFMNEADAVKAGYRSAKN